MADKSKILLVESSLFFLTLEKQFLNRMPIDLLEATSAGAALEICQSAPPGLIYLATDLKGTSGIDLCRQLKDNPEFEKIPIILVCSEGQNDPTVAERSGCDAILMKPLDKKHFLEIGRSFLAGFREPRRPCLLSVQINHNNSAVTAKALDLSNGGLFLKSTEDFPVGTMLEMEFNLAKDGEVGPKMAVTGQVTWHNTADNPTKPHHPVGFGVKFVEPQITFRNLLNGFIRVLDAHA